MFFWVTINMWGGLFWGQRFPGRAVFAGGFPCRQHRSFVAGSHRAFGKEKQKAGTFRLTCQDGRLTSCELLDFGWRLLSPVCFVAVLSLFWCVAVCIRNETSMKCLPVLILLAGCDRYCENWTLENMSNKWRPFPLTFCFASWKITAPEATGSVFTVLLQEFRGFTGLCCLSFVCLYVGVSQIRMSPSVVWAGSLLSSPPYYWTYVCVYTHIYIYIWYPPPKIDHFQCFISGDTSQNLQGLGLLASQLHLASACWLHRMNMLKQPEEIKKKKSKQSGSWERMPRSESRKVNKPRRNQTSQKKNKKSRSWSRMPRPSDYLSQGLVFLCFFDFLEDFHFSRF